MGCKGKRDKRIHGPNVRPCRCDVFGLDFGEFRESARKRIHTAHVYGGKDPKWHSAMQLAEFCDNRMKYDHGGSHETPRSTDVSTRIADIIRQVARQQSLVVRRTTRLHSWSDMVGCI